MMIRINIWKEEMKNTCKNLNFSVGQTIPNLWLKKMGREAHEPLGPSRASFLQCRSPCSLPSYSSASATSSAMQASSRPCCSLSSPMSSSSPPCSPSVPSQPTGPSKQGESTSCCHAPWGLSLGDLLVFFFKKDYQNYRTLFFQPVCPCTHTVFLYFSYFGNNFDAA